MTRFPDHVSLCDTGVDVPLDVDDDGEPVRGSPCISVPALVTVHDSKQDGGLQVPVVYVGNNIPVKLPTNTPFDVLYDVLISTSEYFFVREWFRSWRENPEARQLKGVAGLPLPYNSPSSNNPYRSLFTPGRIPQGVYRYPDRQNVLVTPVPHPDYIDPFGTPLDHERNELGLSIAYQMVRKEITRFVCRRGINAF